MRVKRRRKSSRNAGSQTHKRGAKERTRGSGNQGGKGMAGTGKRGDQKKTLVIKLFGNNYFGKDKTLRRGATAPKLDVINLGNIELRLASLKQDKGVIDLTGYKILGEGELTSKVKIKASAASASAVEKAKASGSEIILEKIEEKTEKEKSEKPAAKPKK